MATKYPKVNGLNLNYDSTKYLARGNRYGAGAADGVAIESKFILDNYTGQFLTYALEYLDNKATSGIEAVKTGVSTATFSPLNSTLVFKSDSSVSSNISLAVLGKDGSEAKGSFTITLPSANKIVQTASSYTSLVSVVNTLGTSYTTLNSTVKTINAASGAGSFRQGDTDTLTAAKKYADDKVSNLGSVYHIEGTKTLTEIKALTNVKQGSVYNVSEVFKIDDKPYSEYTNIVFLADTATVTYDENKGFSGTVVDALGGVQDLSAYSFKANTIQTINVGNSGNTLSDTGTATTIVTIGAGKENGTTQAPVSITAKLPTTLAKVSSPKLETSANSLKLSGLTNLSGVTVTPLSYKSATATITSTAGSTSDSQKFSVSVGGELGSTGTSSTVSLTKASASAFGVVKTGDGINNTSGVISIPQNEFKTSNYLDISSVDKADNGKIFTLDIVCNTATPSAAAIIPLQKADSTTLGIKINTTTNTYIKLKQSTIDLGIDETALITKINSITSAATALESRVTALETLLSLA